MRVWMRSLASRLESGSKEEGLGFAHDGATERDALPLAARQLARLALEQGAELEDVGGCVHPSLDVLPGRAPHAQAKGEIVEHSHVRIQGVRLEHHRDISIPGRHLVDNLVADLDIALRDLLEACQHAQRG